MKRLSEEVSNAQKKAKISNIEKENELGVIESVCLKNFMCHDHLKFDFDPHINFIIGQNGSGKSAVLTGIILALGGKSSFTGRYSNIKGFVKTGKQKAHISVVLRNRGYRAYKPEVYGEKVLIERELSIEGVSSYKLKSEAGRIISTQKEELNNILNSMDIQIENPVVILTQETSRNFLMSKTGREEKLYEFFYKGTNLFALEQNYQASAVSKEEAEKELNAKLKAIPNMEKDLSKWKRFVDSSTRVTELKRELHWANVRELEIKVEEAKLSLKKINKDLATSKQEAEKCKVQYNKFCLDLEEYKKQKLECDTIISTLRQELSDLSTQRDAKADVLRKSIGAVDLYKRQEEKLKKDITTLETEIKETESVNQTNFEEKKKQQSEKIELLKQQNANANMKQESLVKEIAQLMGVKNQKLQEVDNMKAEINNLESKKANIITSRQRLNHAIKNREVLFGEPTSDILRELKRRSREFIHMPKGPIGLYIEVKDPKWNNAVETCLKPNMLRSFCCDNAKDSALLTNILKRYYRQNMPSVIVSKFTEQIYDVSRHKAISQHLTVFDMLKFQDPVIANCLIDQGRIENIILIEDIQTAQPVMLDNPPRNCFSAFLLNCDEMLLNPYRHYSASRRITNSMLQSVNQSHIASMDQEFREVSQQIAAVENQIGSLRSEIPVINMRLREYENEIVKLTSSQKLNNRQITELQQFEEPRDVSGMQDDLVGLRKECNEKSYQKKEAEKVYAKSREEYQVVNQQLQEKKNLLQREKVKFDELGKEITKCGENKEILASSKKQFEQSIKTTEGNLKNLEAALIKDMDSVEKVREAATEICERIATDRSIEEIQLQISETQKVIEESSNCRREEVLNKYKERLQALRLAKDQAKKIENNVFIFAKMLKRREKRFKAIKNYTQYCLDMAFALVLKSNNFTGKLDFSKPGSLHLQATPKQSNPESGGKKHCSALSGGERSFVTISFLLAVWDRIKAPFRILDEYDVFMDSNNRDLSINLLIKRAAFIKDVQFIFLSPLELPLMRETDNIKVHKMPAPKRMGLTMDTTSD